MRASSAGTRRTASRSGAMPFDLEADALELRAFRQQRIDLVLGGCDAQRLEQQLRGRRAGLVQRLQLLVDHALVRGVRVDDDQAVAALRQDVQTVQLRDRDAERLLVV